jgi:hypothetical protein
MIRDDTNLEPAKLNAAVADGMCLPLRLEEYDTTTILTMFRRILLFLPRCFPRSA